MSDRELTPSPNFNRIARLYRWAEYLTLGPLLARTRNHFLSRLTYARRALVLGDGDGRFTARLFQTASAVRITAVDSSSTMLRLLARRSRPFADRLTTRHTDARTFTPTEAPDLIVTHFFLDCLTQPELDALVARLTANLRPRALWLVSEFRIPTGPLRWPARLFIRLLYLVFRLLTGLRITHLPNHSSALRRAGFLPVVVHRRLLGILTSELWKQTAPASASPETQAPPPQDPHDAQPNPEPIAPSLDQPDPAVFHHKVPYNQG